MNGKRANNVVWVFVKQKRRAERQKSSERGEAPTRCVQQRTEPREPPPLLPAASDVSRAPARRDSRIRDSLRRCIYTAVEEVVVVEEVALSEVGGGVYTYIYG